jgi:hypothetical protein
LASDLWISARAPPKFPEKHMNDLLRVEVNAHDRLERWNELKTVKAALQGRSSLSAKAHTSSSPGRGDAELAAAEKEREKSEDSLARVGHTTLACCSEFPEGALTDQLSAFLSLSRRIESVTSALDREI